MVVASPRAKDSCVDLPFYTHDAAGLLSSESVNDEGVIEISDGRHVTKQADGEEVGIGWLVTYRRGDAPKIGIPERSVFTVVDGRIAAMRDEYDDTAMTPVGAWLQQYGANLDGSYV